ncbi:MAG TPA: hypothetical protein PKL31_09650 [Fulvivirga sp.]|nr:hypothetical protein [Fulvivirga sp.]
MIGYDRQKRANYFHFDEIGKWKKQGWISDAEYRMLDEKLMPRYDSTNFFIRIGLFLLTTVILSAGIGFGGLLVSGIISNSNAWFFCLMAAGGCITVLQKIVIEERNQFRSGMDDAALYGGLQFIFLAFFLLLEDIFFNDPLMISVFCFFFFLVPTRIYLDRLLTAITVFSAYAIFFFALDKLDGLWAAPFLMMAVSAIFYVASKKAIDNTKGLAHEECWWVVKWIAIVMFYAAGNCFVVIELSVELLGIADSSAVPFKWLFYIFTVLVPAAYIYFGLQKKHLALLNIGLLAVAVSVFSIRYYHNYVPIELILIIGGLFLIAIAWLALRYWKTDRKGITIKPDEVADQLIVESLIIDQTLGVQDAPSGFEGGGGKFGGGGASGEF